MPQPIKTALCPLINVPLDSMGIICSFLIVRSHVKLSLTCRSLRQQCTHPRTWHQVTFDDSCEIPPAPHSFSMGDVERALTGSMGRIWSEVRVLHWPRYRVGRNRLPESLHGLLQCTRLQHLSLKRARFIPDLSPLAGCSQLISLDATDHVKDLRMIAPLTQLRELSLSGVSLLNTSALSGLTRLEKLTFRLVNIKSIEVLSSLTNLRWLQLPHSSVRDIQPLGNLTKLRSLSLEATPVRQFSALSNLLQLRQLDLDDTMFMDLSEISMLQELKGLYLRATWVKKLDALSALRKLQNLGLNDTEVIDIAPLASLTNLRHLSLKGVNIRSVLPLSTLISLRSMKLFMAHVPDLKELKTLSTLTRLDEFILNCVGDDDFYCCDKRMRFTIQQVTDAVLANKYLLDRHQRRALYNHI